MENQMKEQNIEGKKKKRFGCLIAVIVVVILLVGAVISIPSILTIQPKSKQSEAKQNLGAIFTTQVAYYGEFDHYAGGANCFDLLRWTPEGNTQYSYYCGSDKIACTNCDGKCPEPEFLDYEKDSFTIFAVGNFDKDSDCDVWTINDVKSLQNTVSDLD